MNVWGRNVVLTLSDTGFKLHSNSGSSFSYFPFHNVLNVLLWCHGVVVDQVYGLALSKIGEAFPEKYIIWVFNFFFLAVSIVHRNFSRFPESFDDIK